MLNSNALPQSPHFKIEKLAEGVFAAIAINGGAAISNSGIIDLGGRTLIYDTFMTPQAAQDLRGAAQKLTGRDPELIINSHYHNDHIWGNQAFSPQARIFSTGQTLHLIQTEGKKELDWARESSTKRLEEFRRQYEEAENDQERSELLMWVGYYQGLVDAGPQLNVRLPDITFENRLNIHGSSRTVELIPFEEAHTGSDLILYMRQEGIVFLTDLLFVNCHPYLAECDVYKLMEALKEIQNMQANVFVPGHGPVGTNRDLKSNIDYISMCIETAQKLVVWGNTSPERIAQERPPEKFAGWELSRFFSANLQVLCKKFNGQ
jgi:cyclase